MDAKHWLPTSVGMASILLGGCATQLNAVFRRPIIEDTVSKDVTALSLDASRRVIMVHHSAERFEFCAEPPPDVADKITAALEASLTAKFEAEGKGKAEGSGSVKDNFTLDGIVLSERTVVADIFRTATYALCQYRANRYIGNKDLLDAYTLVLTRTLDIIAAADAASTFKRNIDGADTDGGLGIQLKRNAPTPPPQPPMPPEKPTP